METQTPTTLKLYSIKTLFNDTLGIVNKQASNYTINEDKTLTLFKNGASIFTINYPFWISIEEANE